jgi:hypothetical protein
MTAESATLKLDNHKNGWTGVCVHQEANGEVFNCPVKALARRVMHIRENGGDQKALLSAIYVEGVCYDVTGDDISKGLKMAAMLLNYPSTQGIPIERINTHSLHSGGANALALSGYSNTQIQKMSRWKGATFKEYIREELACYLTGMSSKMKQNFKFVNISRNTYNNVTGRCLEEDYSVNLLVAEKMCRPSFHMYLRRVPISRPSQTTNHKFTTVSHKHK